MKKLLIGLVVITSFSAFAKDAKLTLKQGQQALAINQDFEHILITCGKIAVAREGKITIEPGTALSITTGVDVPVDVNEHYTINVKAGEKITLKCAL